MKENSEHIEDYLAGKLEGEARERFELAVQNDPELAAELALYRDMATALAPAEEDALRANLERLNRQYTSAPRKTRLWWILGFLLLTSMVIWLIRRPVATESPLPPPTEQGAQKDAPPVAQQTEPLPLPGPTQNPDSLQREQKAGKSPAEPRRLAGAFEPNPRLESLLGNQLRGDNYRFLIAQPTKSAALKRRGGKADFLLAGKLETTAVQVNTPFRVLLFTNKLEDYENFRFLSAAPLVFEKNGGAFRFRFGSSLRVQPGLYYYLIEDEDSGLLYYIGKFRVEE